MDFSSYDQRPIIVAIAGPSGAGKTTFFHSHLAAAGLRFVNADVLAAELAVAPYEAARVADALRRELLKRSESFVFETVFSDSVGDKVGFLKEAARKVTSWCSVTSDSTVHSNRSSALLCECRRAVTTFPTTSSWRGTLERSTIFKLQSMNCRTS